MDDEDSPYLSAPHTKKGQIQRALKKLLIEHESTGALPTNGRFLFYELVQAGVVPKHNPGKWQPAQDVTAALTRLRNEGLVPWNWIVDETRTLHNWEFAENAYQQYTKNQVRRARIDLWGGEEALLVLCESAAVAGVLEADAAQYLVPVAAVRGQCKGFIITEIVPLLRGARRVLYMGDWEERGPGEQIEAHTKRVIEEHTDEVFGDYSWQRVALTREQVEANPRLLELKITKHDNRNNPPKEYEAVECEAIGQTVLQGILRAKLDELLPEPLEAVLERQREQIEQMHEAMRLMEVGGTPSRTAMSAAIEDFTTVAPTPCWRRDYVVSEYHESR